MLYTCFWSVLDTNQTVGGFAIIEAPVLELSSIELQWITAAETAIDLAILPVVSLTPELLRKQLLLLCYKRRGDLHLTRT